MNGELDAAVTAIRAGHPEEAIATLEALADRGVVGAGVAFDRGLAYATRAKVGGGRPGDLGRAAHGFEEAIRRDPSDTIARAALDEIRREIAQRELTTGLQPLEIDAPPAWRAIVVAAPGNVWVSAALGAAMVMAIALAVRPRLARGPRLAASTIVIVTFVVAALASALGLGARWVREHVHEAVVVSSGAIAVSDQGARIRLAEGARVDVIDERMTSTKIRVASGEGWVSRDALRTLPSWRP